MERMLNDTNLDKQRWETAGAILGVERQIKAAVASQQKKDQPSFKHNGNTRSSSQDGGDSLLGSLLADCLFGVPLGQVFASAVHMPEALQAVDWSNTIDLYDEYAQDRAQAHERKKQYELGQKKTLSRDFNLQKTADASGLKPLRQLAARLSPTARPGQPALSF